MNASQQEISNANKKAMDRMLANYMHNGQPDVTEKDFSEPVKLVIEKTKSMATPGNTAHQKIEYADGSALKISALIHQYGHVVWWVKEA